MFNVSQLNLGNPTPSTVTGNLMVTRLSCRRSCECSVSKTMNPPKKSNAYQLSSEILQRARQSVNGERRLVGSGALVVRVGSGGVIGDVHDIAHPRNLLPECLFHALAQSHARAGAALASP